MRDLFLLLIGGAIGAGLGWFWDDQRGDERRRMVQGRLNQARDQVRGQAESMGREVAPKVEQLRDLKDRAVAEAQR